MSLSIFSFEKLGAAIRLPAKAHLWHLSLFVGATLLVFAASGILSSLFDPPPTQLDRVDREKIEVLVLGNSQALSLKPENFSVPILNASEGLADYGYLWAILKTIAPDLPRLKTVILQLDTLPLRVNAMKGRGGDFSDLADWKVDWRDLPNTSVLDKTIYGISYQSPLRPLLIGPKLEQPRIDTLLQELTIFHSIARSLFPRAYATSEGQDTSIAKKKVEDRVRPGFHFAPSAGKRKMAEYIKAYGHSQMQDRNRAYFRMIGELCESLGLRLILVRTPTTQSFWKARPSHWEEEVQDLIRIASSIFGETEVPVWDLERTTLYPARGFYDPNHTLPPSSADFSMRIDNRLQRLKNGAPTIPQPLNPNPSFESEDLDGWNGSNFQVSTEHSRTGEKGLVVETGESSWGGVYYGSTGFPKSDPKTFPCEPNTDYLVSVWVLGLENFEGVQFQIHAFQDLDNNFAKNHVELSGRWRRIAHPFRTGPETTHLGFMLSKLDNPASAIIALDDFEIVKTSLEGDPE